MRKAGIIIAMAVWIVTAVRLINVNVRAGEDVVTAFNTIKYDNVDTIIEAFGEYGKSYMEDGEKEEALVSIASCIGIDKNYDIEHNGDVITLLNRSADGEVKMALNTTTEDYGTYKSCTNYISINMTIIGRTDCALTYKNMIDDIFAAGKIDGYVNMSLKGELNGAVNYYERNRLADELLDILDAKVVSENRENDLFTIYAYTGLVDEYVMSAGRKININIVQEYDSVANKTVIYLSTPLNNLDY